MAKVNGELKQHSEINKMTWSTPDIIVFISEFVYLKPGDLVEGGISGLNEIKFLIKK